MGHNQKTNVTIEHQLLEQGLNALRKETGVTGYIAAAEVGTHKKIYNAEIIITPPGKEQQVRLTVEIKRHITRTVIGAFAYQFRQMQKHPILITRYVNPNLAAKLKDLNVQFIDTCGNAYINAAPFYIFVKGNKPGTSKQTPPQTARAFRPAGLRVIFTLLCNPGLEAMPLRFIANKARVALGTTNAVFKDLKILGYLIDKGRYGRTLVNKKNLLDRWVTTYPEVMRPKAIIGRYTAKDHYWWKEALLPDRFYWGGEVAATKITKYLKPEIITLYTDVEQPTDFLLRNKMKKDDNGQVEILKQFWNTSRDIDEKHVDEFEGQQHLNTVHPILVYADLVAITDARNHEVARILYDNELYKFIE